MFGTDRGFVPKNPNGGVMANYCLRCGAHKDFHFTKNVMGGGSVLTCPAVPPSLRTVSPHEPRSEVVPEPTHQSSTTPVRPVVIPQVIETPFGTELTAERDGNAPAKLSRRIVSPPNSLAGSSCYVYKDNVPVTEACGKKVFPIGDHLVGSSAASTFEEQHSRPGLRRKPPVSQVSLSGILQ